MPLNTNATPTPPDSVDTTKTRLGPRRVRMSSGERPIGAAKGKQSDTEALCQSPPPPPAGTTHGATHPQPTKNMDHRGGPPAVRSALSQSAAMPIR